MKESARNRQPRDYTIGKDALEFFFSCIGVFNHQSYFTQEQWRKVSMFKDTDPAEIKCAFLSKWTRETVGKITYPLGLSWSCWNGSEECYESYIARFRPIFDDYFEWCKKQR